MVPSPSHCHWLAPPDVVTHNAALWESSVDGHLTPVAGETEAAARQRHGAAPSVWVDHLVVTFYDLATAEPATISLFDAEAFCLQQYREIQQNQMRCVPPNHEEL